MANLGLIDFKIGLYIKVNVNERQNKFEVHISKHLAKMAINWYIIDHMPLWARTLNGYNSAFSSNFDIFDDESSGGYN